MTTGLVGEEGGERETGLVSVFSLLVRLDLSGYVYTAAGSKPPTLGRHTHASAAHSRHTKNTSVNVVACVLKHRGLGGLEILSSCLSCDVHTVVFTALLRVPLLQDCLPGPGGLLAVAV